MEGKFYIAVVSYFPSKDSFRGAFLMDQAQAIRKLYKGKIVVIKIVGLTSSEKDYSFENIEVKIVKSIKFPSNFLPYFFSKLNTFIFRRKLRKLNINVMDIEAIHCHDMHNSVYGAYIREENLEVKFFVQVHGLDVLEVTNGRIQNKLNRYHIINCSTKFCAKTDYIVGVSQLTVDQFRKYPSFDKYPFFVLYNGVDYEKFYTVENETSANLVLGCIANFIPVKDHITLMKALVIVKQKLDFTCRLVGAGPTLALIKQFVSENGLSNNIEFFDKISHTELVKFYNSLDLYIMPSYYESLGCVYLEAYTCGVPFISVRGMGVSELIEEKQIVNWTIDKGDYKTLASLILNYKQNGADLKLNRDVNIDIFVEEFLRVAKIIS